MAKNTQDPTVKKLQPLIRFVKLFSHPVRLFVVMELLDGDECSVGYLVSRLKIEFSVVSKHLAILKKAGIVTTIRDRQWVYYRLKNAEIISFVRQLQSLHLPFSR
ncbi:MAG: metalloregulator ArsR/SmtB family transcription factor [Thermoguttaceae bacterium]|nr:metalloregulator ArsR/SmtB family transcription factor [Thermoguttaceae bacterium]